VIKRLGRKSLAIEDTPEMMSLLKTDTCTVRSEDDPISKIEFGLKWHDDTYDELNL
jgi:hypothetical protein